jgi:16S rRNA processing protein RimM
VKGWVKVFSYTDPMESIVDYNPWYVRPQNRSRLPWKKVRIEAGKRHAKTVIAKLEDCNDRDEAQSYTGSEIAIVPEQLEELSGKDEYYWRELTGLRVINQQDFELGTVEHLMETGANDVLVVVAEEGPEKLKKERLIPWILHDVVLAVELEQGILRVDWDPDF